QSMGIVSEFSDLVEDPAGDRSVELPQLANGRLGPDDLEGRQKPSSSFSCWWVRYLPALTSRTACSISFLVCSFSSWRSSRSLSRTFSWVSRGCSFIPSRVFFISWLSWIVVVAMKQTRART